MLPVYAGQWLTHLSINLMDKDHTLLLGLACLADSQTSESEFYARQESLPSPSRPLVSINTPLPYTSYSALNWLPAPKISTLSRFFITHVAFYSSTCLSDYRKK